MGHKIHVVIVVVVDELNIFLKKRNQMLRNESKNSLPSSFSRSFILTMYGTNTLLICTQPDSFVSREGFVGV